MVTGLRHSELAADITARAHTLVSGVQAKLGGSDEGLDPHELVEAALTACTIITVQMYANRKQWPLISTDVQTKITSETKELATIERTISFRGELDDDQRERLMKIADQCPIHKLLQGQISIETKAGAR